MLCLFGLAAALDESQSPGPGKPAQAEGTESMETDQAENRYRKEIPLSGKLQAALWEACEKTETPYALAPA